MGNKWTKQDVADIILCLLQQEEITRGKALELLRELHERGSVEAPCPWGKLNWNYAAPIPVQATAKETEK